MKGLFFEGMSSEPFEEFLEPIFNKSILKIQ